MEKFNAGRYIIENFFKQLTMISMETFKVLNMGIDNKLGWGLIVILFFLVNSAKAAPMGNEISEINFGSCLSPPRDLFRGEAGMGKGDKVSANTRSPHGHLGRQK